MPTRLSSLLLKWIYTKGTIQLTPPQVRMLLVTVTFVLLPFLFFLSWFTMPMLLIFVTWRYYLEVRQAALPSFLTKLALLSLLTGLIAWDQQTLLGRDAGTSFLMGLLGIKLLELRTPRDFIVICLLCFFMIAGALLFSQSLIMVFYLACAIILIHSSLARLHSTAPNQPEVFSAWRFTTRVFYQSLPLALLIFLCFPRMQANFAFQLRPSITGLSDYMQPGDIARLANDARIAFRVDFPNHDKPAGIPYWRGLIFWNTDGREWHVGARPRPAAQAHIPNQPGITQQITLMPHAQRWMFALDYPIAAPARTIFAAGSILESRSIVFRKTQYTVRSHLSGNPQDMSLDIETKTLQLPRRLSPRMVSLVREWQAKAPQPRDMVQTGLRYFHDNGFLYTLSPGRYDGPDPMGDFLFDRKQGFCEHFASSFALLMRIAGIPSRLVAGYMGGEYNPYGGFMTVRQANAHVWVEVWLPDEGWVRIDPTAALSSDQIETSVQNLLRTNGAAPGSETALDPTAGANPARRFVHFMRLWRELIEDRWDRWVLAYDLQTQENILKFLGLESRGWLWVGTMLLLATFTTLWTVTHFLKRRSRSQNPLEHMYRTFCNRLAAAGVSRHSWEGPLAFGQRAAKHLPSQANPIQTLASLYADLRYGPVSTSTQLGEFQERLRDFHPGRGRKETMTTNET